VGVASNGFSFIPAAPVPVESDDKAPVVGGDWLSDFRRFDLAVPSPLLGRVCELLLLPPLSRFAMAALAPAPVFEPTPAPTATLLLLLLVLLLLPLIPPGGVVAVAVVAVAVAAAVAVASLSSGISVSITVQNPAAPFDCASAICRRR